jgi:hypothetical protein
MREKEEKERQRQEQKVEDEKRQTKEEDEQRQENQKGGTSTPPCSSPSLRPQSSTRFAASCCAGCDAE